MPFFTRLAVLVAAGCFLPALNAAAEDEVPPTAICPNTEASFSGVITVPDGPPAGAEYVVCMPAPQAWIGDIVIFVHGVVDPREGPGEIESILGQLDTNGLIVPATTNELGYAFAVLSRSDLGLSDAQLAQAELIELVAAFAEGVNASSVFPEFVFRFGHCNFEQAEALAAFALLVLQVDGLDITLDIARALVEPEALERFWAFADRIGLVP